MTGANEDAVAQNRDIGKNKMLIQALDTSGSMSGAPIEALRIGATLIGQRFFEADQRPFEQFITMEYNSDVTTYRADNFEEYKGQINGLRAGGGTNFMNVFERIQLNLD